MSDSSDLTQLFIEAVSGVFESLGRALVCLDADFQVVHASNGLDALAGDENASQRVLGLSAERVFGEEAFGKNGSLRQALVAGERREGWGAAMRIDDAAPRLMSISAAPIGSVDSPLCDPRVAYLVVVRSAADPSVSQTAIPTLFAGMIGRSSAMLQIFRLIQNLEESDATVLITGESGTGKELVARALHVHSPRSRGRFVVVSCTAIPGELLESELFGHVRGAFTGAIRDRMGRFELADGGTLLLDEIGDMPLQLQAKLLRVLQERTFERVGENRSRQTDGRIIAATNRDLQRAVLAGTFREDLFYRLRVVPIHLAPLRERREDIEPLMRHLLSRISDRHGRSLRPGPDALRTLLGYPWPGNVRELENALEYAVAVCRGQTIHTQDLPLEVQGAPEGSPRQPLAEPSTHSTEPAREQIRAALESHRWRRAETARALGMSRSTLWRRMRELGLTDDR